jgi:hypothetical protein
MKNLFLTMTTLTLLSTTVFAKSGNVTTWLCTNEFSKQSAGKIEMESTPGGWQKGKNLSVPMYYYSSLDTEQAWELKLDIDTQDISNASFMVQGGNPFKVGDLVPSSKANAGAELDVKLEIRGSKLRCQR